MRSVLVTSRFWQKSEEISNSLEEHTRICFFCFCFCLFVYSKGMVDIESPSFFNFFYYFQYVFILVAAQDEGSIYRHFSKNNVYCNAFNPPIHSKFFET